MRKRLWIIVLMSLGLALVACSASDATPTAPGGVTLGILSADQVKRISPADAKALLDEGAAVLYDTRSLDLYSREHAAGAVSLPSTTPAAQLGELPLDKDLIFYCT